MTIPEQAVKAASTVLNRAQYVSNSQVLEALTAAAPHMSAPARDQALGEAVRDACMYLETGFIECPRCGEEVETKNTDAEYTLRSALKSQPEQTGGGNHGE